MPQRVVGIAALLFLATLPTLAAPALAADDDLMRDLSVVQKPIVALAPSAPAGLSVTAWVDQQDVTYEVGESLTLFVKVNKDAYVTVLDQGTSGDIHVVFPNSFQSDHRMRAGQVLALGGPGSPFAYKVSGPAGIETFKIIASTQPAPVFPSAGTKAAGPFQTLQSSGAEAARDIEVVLNQDHAGQWDQYTKLVRIKDPAAAAIAATVPAAPADGKFGLSVATDRPAYRVGDLVRIHVKADKDCALTLVNRGTSGKATVVFPNRYQRNNVIRGGEAVVIPPPGGPYGLAAVGPQGTETIVAVCRTDGKPFYTGPFDWLAHIFQPWGDDRAFERDLAVVASDTSPAVTHADAAFAVSP